MIDCINPRNNQYLDNCLLPLNKNWQLNSRVNLGLA